MEDKDKKQNEDHKVINLQEELALRAEKPAVRVSQNHGMTPPSADFNVKS